jgi:hypothetical protein
MAINRYRAEPPVALRESLNDAWESYAAAATDAGLPLPRHPDFAASLRRVGSAANSLGA